MARRWGDTHDQLATHLSPEAFAELVAMFGGQVIRVPRTIRETRAERSERVLALLRDETYQATAEAVGCSVSTVQRDAVRSTDNT